MMRKAAIVVVFVILIGGSLFIPINSSPPKNTRIILEHTYKTYIAPPCFEQAQATNNLAESNLAKARELNYKAESSCTEELLKPERKPLFKILLEKIALTGGRWNW